MEKVLIFRNELLPISETFIRGQAAALKTFQPQYAGLRRAKRSLAVPDDAIILDQGAGKFTRSLENIYKYTGFASSFRARVLQAKPDLVHAHFALDAINALPLVRDLRVPLIVTLHGADVTTADRVFRKRIGGWRYLLQRRKLWQRASAFLCVSEFIRRKATELGFPENKLTVHYTGIDLTQFAYRETTRQQDLVLFVGRLTEKKGCEYLIRALAIVKQRKPHVRLVVIGDGPLRSSLEAIAREERIDCQFLGAQPSDVVSDWISCSRVFCTPSVTAASGDSEGLGMVFAEAQAMGTPVVSFHHGGIPEVVCHGATGLLAPERDLAALAQHVLRYLSDDIFWNACSTHGSKWIKERFDINAQTAKLEALYSEVVTNNNVGSL